MPDSSLIAVLLPVYSGSKANEVRLAVRSILRQTWPADIYIGIDGMVSSSLEDYLYSLPEKYPFTFLVSSDESIGLANILNKSITFAFKRNRYKYFARMDGDDFSTKERLEIQARYMNNNPSISIVGSDLIIFDDFGNKKYRSYPSEHKRLVDDFVFRSPLAHPAVMIRSDVFLAFKYDPGYYLNEDYKLWSDVIIRGLLIANIPAPLLYFRFGSGTYIRRVGTKVSFSEFRLRVFFLYKTHSINLFKYCFAFLMLIIRMLPPALIRQLYKASIVAGKLR